MTSRSTLDLMSLAQFVSSHIIYPTPLSLSNSVPIWNQPVVIMELEFSTQIRIIYLLTYHPVFNTFLVSMTLDSPHFVDVAFALSVTYRGGFAQEKFRWTNFVIGNIHPLKKNHQNFVPKKYSVPFPFFHMFFFPYWSQKKTHKFFRFYKIPPVGLFSIISH